MVALQNQGFNKQIPCLKHSWRTMQKIAAFHLKRYLFCSHYKLFRSGWDLHFLNSFPAEQLLSCLWWECLCDMGHTRCFMNLQPSQGYSLATRTLYEHGKTHGKGHKNNSGLFQIWRDLPCFSGSASKKKGFNLHVGLKIIVWCKDCVKSKLLLSCFHGQYTDRLPKTEWIQAPWNCLKSHCSVSIMNTDFNFCMV